MRASELIQVLRSSSLRPEDSSILRISELSAKTFSKIIELLNGASLSPFVKELHLSFSSDPDIPGTIQFLTNLNAIVVDHAFFEDKKLKTIPDSIRSLPNLKSLILEGQDIGVVPSWIGELQELRSLALGQNSISQLPPSLGNLKKLEFLSIRINNISFLPQEVSRLPKLNDIVLDGNPLKTLPARLLLNPNFLNRFHDWKDYVNLEKETNLRILRSALKFSVFFRLLMKVQPLSAHIHIVAMVVRKLAWDEEFNQGNLYCNYQSDYMALYKEKHKFSDPEDFKGKALQPTNLTDMFKAKNVLENSTEEESSEENSKYSFGAWYVD